MAPVYLSYIIYHGFGSWDLQASGCGSRSQLKTGPFFRFETQRVDPYELAPASGALYMCMRERASLEAARSVILHRHRGTVLSRYLQN